MIPRTRLRVLLTTLLLVSAVCAGCGDGDDFGPPRTVTVSFEGQDHQVDLGQLPTLDIDEVPYVRLSSIVTAVLPDEPLESLQLENVEDAAGVSPTIKDYCTPLIPVDGLHLDKGYIQTSSGNLLWEDSMQYPGCMSWRDVVHLTFSKKGV